MEQTAMWSSVSKTKPIWLVPSPSILPFCLIKMLSSTPYIRSIAHNMGQKLGENKVQKNVFSQQVTQEDVHLIHFEDQRKLNKSLCNVFFF